MKQQVTRLCSDRQLTQNRNTIRWHTHRHTHTERERKRGDALCFVVFEQHFRSSQPCFLSPVKNAVFVAFWIFINSTQSLLWLKFSIHFWVCDQYILLLKNFWSELGELKTLWFPHLRWKHLDLDLVLQRANTVRAQSSLQAFWNIEPFVGSACLALWEHCQPNPSTMTLQASVHRGEGGGGCSDTVLRYPTTTWRGSPARTLDCVWWQLKVSHTHVHADRTIFRYDSRKSKRDVLTSRFTKKCWLDLYPVKEKNNVSQLQPVRTRSLRHLSVKTPISRRRQRRAAATTVRRSADNADGCRVSAAWNEG